jgi:hypothetical protein
MRRAIAPTIVLTTGLALAAGNRAATPRAEPDVSSAPSMRGS